ncbi:MAG: hypothetical protein HFK08_00070 [Clostridia bacterium]|nr:hypothetical protein [Clostridia bacterium]
MTFRYGKAPIVNATPKGEIDGAAENACLSPSIVRYVCHSERSEESQSIIPVPPESGR